MLNLKIKDKLKFLFSKAPEEYTERYILMGKDCGEERVSWFQEVIKELSDFETFVDVGSGVGNTLTIAKELGSFKNLIGIEPNKEAYEFCKANTSFELHNLRADEFDFSTLPGPSLIYFFGGIDTPKEVRDAVGLRNLSNICSIKEIRQLIRLNGNPPEGSLILEAIRLGVYKA